MGIGYIETDFGNLSDFDYKKLNAMMRNQLEMYNLVDNYKTGVIGWKLATKFSIASTTYENISGLNINIDRSKLNFNTPRLIKINFFPFYIDNAESSNLTFSSQITVAEKFNDGTLENGYISSDVTTFVKAGYSIPAMTHTMTNYCSNKDGVTTVSIQGKISATGNVIFPSGAYVVVEDLGVYVGVTT